MTDNSNVNMNLRKFHNTPEVFRKDSIKDTVSPGEEITVTKTEIKEESCDFEMSLDNVEFIDIKEEPTYSPESVFIEENLELTNNTERLLNENLDIENCEIEEMDHENNMQCFVIEKKISEGTDASVDHNAKQKKYKCTDCNYNTHNLLNMKEHIRVHANDRPFKCTYKNCKCTPEKARSCACNMCYFATTSKGRLIKHMSMRHGIVIKKYMCGDCKYESYTEANLERHVCLHSNDRKFKCTYKHCKCTPAQEKPCECATCEYATTTDSCLKTHILKMHNTDPKTYKCTECNYSTDYKVNLVLHVRIHTGEKPFKCTCKNCKCKPGQKEPCKCGMCEFASSSRYRLKHHILSKHCAKPIEFKCGDCDYSTLKKLSLMVHTRIHSGEKPFRCMYKNCECIHGQEEPCDCSMCEFTATSSCNLKRHILIKHSAEVKK